MSLPAWPGGRNTCPLLQSSGHLCCAGALPQCLSLCLSYTAYTVPGSASVMGRRYISLSLCRQGLFKLLMLPFCLAGVNVLSSGPWILVEDLSSVYNDIEVERASVKHAHKKRKLADGRDKTMVS